MRPFKVNGFLEACDYKSSSYSFAIYSINLTFNHSKFLKSLNF